MNESIPDDLLPCIFEYYMIGLRHRLNLRKMKELIEFTQGEPHLILEKFCSDVILVMNQASSNFRKVSYAEARKALNNNEGDIVDAIMELTI